MFVAMFALLYNSSFTHKNHTYIFYVLGMLYNKAVHIQLMPNKNYNLM